MGLKAPQLTSIDSFFDKLNNLLFHLSGPNVAIILAGDFNIDVLSKGKHVREFKNMRGNQKMFKTALKKYLCLKEL